MHVLASALALSVVESQNRGWVFLAVTLTVLMYCRIILW